MITETTHKEVQRDHLATAIEQKKIESEASGLKALESASECKEFVDDLFKKVNDVINTEIFKIHKDQRWILRSRVINTLFAQNYGPMIWSAQERVQEIEKEIKKGATA